MTLRGPILAAVDLSEATDEALRQGYAVATDLGVTLVACHVLPEAFRARVLFPQEAHLSPAGRAELEQKAMDAIRLRLATVLGPTGEAVSIAIESGSPHAGILEAAERLGAGLIVVGPGATARHVARSALCPVLIARPSPAGGDVLGATDFSDPSLPAVHMAADEARRRGVGLRLLHCLNLDEAVALAASSAAGVIPVPLMPPDVIETLSEEARDQLTSALARAGATGETLVVRQSPVTGIPECARTPPAALVVVGTRGRTGLSRLMLGSVAEAVMDEAPCSVLVVQMGSG